MCTGGTQHVCFVVDDAERAVAVPADRWEALEKTLIFVLVSSLTFNAALRSPACPQRKPAKLVGGAIG